MLVEFSASRFDRSGEELANLIGGSLVAGTYEQAVDRESAYEKLRGRAKVQSLIKAPQDVPGQPEEPASAPPGLAGKAPDQGSDQTPDPKAGASAPKPVKP